MEGISLKDTRNQRIHMVGIGGASMAGLAEMLYHDGYLVSGSDSAESYALKRLRGFNLDVRAGHHPEMVDGAGLLVYSAAIAVDDPERVEARRLGIPQMERAVLLGEIMQDAARRSASAAHTARPPPRPCWPRCCTKLTRTPPSIWAAAWMPLAAASVLVTVVCS